jgi:uncharacterized membrane protein
MGLDFDSYKDNYTKNIWAKIREIETDIQYSSIFIERKKKNKRKWTSIIYSVILTIPAIKGLAVTYGWLSAKNVLSIIIDIAYLIGGLVFPFAFSEFIMRYIGYYERDITELLALNGRLEILKDKLCRIYSQADSCTTTQTLNNVCKDFESICNEHIGDITEHDRLTGEIDHKLEAEAQKKAIKILKQTKKS